MSELAYNLEGDAIELPAAAQWWRVRRFRNPGTRGAPEVVIDRDGAPVVLPIDATFMEFREAVGAQPGRYRLDPMDDRRKVVPEVAAAYLTLNEPARNGNGVIETEGAEISMMREMARWNTELSRMQLEMARGIADRFSGMMQAAAELIRAADGAGIASRLPPPLPPPTPPEEEERDDDELDDDEAAPTLAGLVGQVLPMIQMWLQVKQSKAAAAVAKEARTDGAEAAVSKPAEEPATETPVAEATPRNRAPFSPTPSQMAHLLAIHQKLTPKERALAQATAAKLGFEEQGELMEELAKLSVDEAADTIRQLLKGPAADGGAS